MIELIHWVIDEHEHRAGWALILLCLILLGFQHSGTVRAVIKSDYFNGIIASIGLIFVLTYGTAISLCLIYPNYIDHFEATVSAISWLGTHGTPIDPSWRCGDTYEAPYGVLLFITNGTVLRLLPTIFGSKLAGSTAL